MKNYIQIIVVFVITVSLFSDDIYGQKERDKVIKGNESFGLGNYEEALNHYRDAALDNPESPAVHYNIGNVLYKQSNYEEAFSEFEKVLTAKNSNMQFRSYYNMGNTLYRMGKLEESILSYTKALQLDSDDHDSKYNLEYVRNQLKQQQQEQDQDQDQNQDQDQQQDQQQQNQDQDQQQDQQDQENEQQQNEQQQQNQQEITKEEAEKILDALKNDEKDLQEKRRMKSSGKVKVKKDW